MQNQASTNARHLNENLYAIAAMLPVECGTENAPAMALSAEYLADMAGRASMDLAAIPQVTAVRPAGTEIVIIPMSAYVALLDATQVAIPICSAKNPELFVF